MSKMIDPKNLGYCCINLSLNLGKKKSESISVNRTMVKKTFDTKGLDYVSDLVILNLEDTLKVLKWNRNNNIFVYRMSSESFPWMTHYKFEDLPRFGKILSILESIGDYSKENNIRLSYHPGPFCVIASQNKIVVNKTIDELNKHAELMDLMGLDKSHYYPINIHINTTKPSREEAAERFCLEFNNLSNSCKSRLTVENDDGPNQYSTKMLYDLVYSSIKIPIVHDFHHHKYGPQDISNEDALRLAITTWGDIKPMTHMSSSRVIESSSGVQTAHADYIYEEINTHGLDFHVEIEAKAKDLAVIDYRKKFSQNV